MGGDDKISRTRDRAIAAFASVGIFLTGGGNIVLPKVRDAVGDQQELFHWQDRIAGELTLGLKREPAERLLMGWGFTVYHYRRDELEPLMQQGAFNDLPPQVASVLLGGRVVGETGSAQPHLRAIIYLDATERISATHTEFIHV